MKKSQRNILLGTLAALLLASAAAATATYVTKKNVHAENTYKPVKKPAAQQMAAAPAVQHCDDGNVLGYAAGGIAGGVLGNQVGGGSGKTAATIGGTLGGAYLGGQYIPLRGATCAH